MKNKTTLDQIFDVINHEGEMQPHASIATVPEMNAYAVHIVDRTLKSYTGEGTVIIKPSEIAIMLSEFKDISNATINELVRCSFCFAEIYGSVAAYAPVLERLNKAVKDKVLDRQTVNESLYRQVKYYHDIPYQEFNQHKTTLKDCIKNLKLYHLFSLDQLFVLGFYDEIKNRIEESKDYVGESFNHPEYDFRFDAFVGKENKSNLDKFNSLFGFNITVREDKTEKSDNARLYEYQLLHGKRRIIFTYTDKE